MNLLNFLTNFWKILGNNSGQIQTIAAFIGLGLAIYALIYSKKQITFAQTERLYSLKLQVSSEYFSIRLKLESILSKIKRMQDIELKKCRITSNAELISRVDILDNELDKVADLISSTKTSLVDFHSAFYDSKSTLSLKDLEDIIIFQIKINESASNSFHTVDQIEIITDSIIYNIST